MDPSVARITSKGQTTVPKNVREYLNVGPGDEILFEIREREVTVRKLPAADRAWLTSLESSLSEWADDLDDEL
ncbi:MAG: AbrB/MazE/SpoVT family DNA-binding domain-containing protein [Spirochaetales bacterium]